MPWPSPVTSTDPVHREALAAAVEVLGGIDLLVNNASDLGPSPLPPLRQLPAGRGARACTRRT